MRRVTTLACAAALLYLGGAPAGSDERIPMSLTADQLHDMQQHGIQPLVIDVRSPAEFADGHIPGAVNVQNDEVAERVPRLDVTRDIVLYCTLGPRAQRAEDALRKAGLKRLFLLEGGLAAWVRAGFALAR